MVINPIIGFYIPIIRIPSLKVGGLPSPTKRDDNLDHGTHDPLRCRICEATFGPGGTLHPSVPATGAVPKTMESSEVWKWFGLIY